MIETRLRLAREEEKSRRKREDLKDKRLFLLAIPKAVLRKISQDHLVFTSTFVCDLIYQLIPFFFKTLKFLSYRYLPGLSERKEKSSTPWQLSKSSNRRSSSWSTMRIQGQVPRLRSVNLRYVGWCFFFDFLYRQQADCGVDRDSMA